MDLWPVFDRLDRVEHKIDALIAMVKQSIKMEKKMSVEFDELILEVEATKTVQQSAVVALNGLVEKVDDLASELEADGIDNAKAIELRDALKASTDTLAAAIPAGTSAE